MAVEKWKSWLPVERRAADVELIQALNGGVANPDQQRRVLAYIVNTVCRTYEPSFDPDSTRNTDHAEGRRWVGLQLVTMTKLSLADLRAREELERKPNERRARK